MQITILPPANTTTAKSQYAFTATPTTSEITTRHNMNIWIDPNVNEKAESGKYDAVEVQPIVDDPISKTCEPTTNPTEADFWSVYLHTPDAGAVCVADLPNEHEANTLASKLETLIWNYLNG